MPDLMVEELIDVLRDVINQACLMEDGTLDSIGFTANANAMRMLARLGKLEIDSEYGRRVIAHWTKGDGNANA